MFSAIIGMDKLMQSPVRWAAVEAVQRVGSHMRLGQMRDRVGQRRNIGVVAAARKLTEPAFYGLRDHRLRCLTPPAASNTANTADPAA